MEPIWTVTHKQRARLLSTTALALAALAGGPAHADSPNDQVGIHPISLRLGVLLPSDSAARDNGGKNPLSIGLDATVLKPSEKRPFDGAVYFDYNGGSKNKGHVSVEGIGVEAASPDKQTDRPHATWVGAGLGLYFVGIKDHTTGITQNTTGIGGKVFAGINIASNLYGELGYRAFPQSNSIHANGIDIDLGYKF